MKRFFLLCSLVVVCFVFVGCGFGKKFNLEISEIDESLFFCEDENFYSTLLLGQREDPYIVDGKKCELVSFAVLTSKKIGTPLMNHSAQFSLTTNVETYTGTFEINPYDNSFVFDLRNIETDFSNIVLQIVADGVIYSYTFENAIKENFATLSEIKETAVSKFSSIKNKITSGGQIQAEVYYRLIKKQGCNTLWVISVVCRNGETFAIVLEPITKDIVAQKL